MQEIKEGNPNSGNQLFESSSVSCRVKVAKAIQDIKLISHFDFFNYTLSLLCIGIYIFTTYEPNFVLINQNAFFAINFASRTFFFIDCVLGLLSNSLEFYVQQGPTAARKLTEEEEDLLDSKTVYKYNLVSYLKKYIFCVIELINQKSVSLLNNTLRKNNDEYRFIRAGLGVDATASFASGEVYYSSIMDNLITQAYYNPSLLTVLKKLIIGEEQNTFLKKTVLNRYN